MLALTLLRERSMLDDELESERLEVWFVVILAFTLLSERSTLLDEFDRLAWVVLSVASVLSRLIEVVDAVVLEF